MYQNARILGNARAVSAQNIPIYIRIPVLPGYNDSAENIRAVCDFARSLPSLVEVDLMPVHHLGKARYESLGREYPIPAETPRSRGSAPRAETHDTIVGVFHVILSHEKHSAVLTLVKNGSSVDCIILTFGVYCILELPPLQKSYSRDKNSYKGRFSWWEIRDEQKSRQQNNGHGPQRAYYSRSDDTLL